MRLMFHIFFAGFIIGVKKASMSVEAAHFSKRLQCRHQKGVEILVDASNFFIRH